MKNIFLLLFILITKISSAQLNSKSTYPVYVNYPNYSVKANVLNLKQNIIVKEGLTYYWYAANKIIDTQGGYDGKILMGTYTSFYLSGNLKERGDFKKGLKDREWTTWFENGKIQQIQSWKRGLMTGQSKTFNDIGECVLLQHYKGGKLHGKVISFLNDTIIDIKKYKHGTEIIKKQKIEKTKKENSEKRKKSVFNFLKSKKKIEKTEPDTSKKMATEVVTPPKKEKKQRKKFIPIFKRKPKVDNTNSNTDIDK